MPEVLEVLDNVDGHEQIFWRIPNGVRTAGGVLQHAFKTMEILRNKLYPMIFKFGMTHDPVTRWENSSYGYRWEKDKWQGMFILFISPEKYSPAMLEAAMIEKFGGSPADVSNHATSCSVLINA